MSENRLLLACAWGNFGDRLKRMRNYENVLLRLKKTCTLVANIFSNMVYPHFIYLDKEEKEGAVALEMKAPVQTNSISDYIHEKVVEKAIELMSYKLDLYVELNEKCPFFVWKLDLGKLMK